MGRFDPNYIKNISYVNNINTLYSLVPLGTLLTEQPMYGANEIAIDGDPQTEMRYIRITDIDDHGKLQNEDWKTAKRVDEKYALDENDILFARSGATAGKTFIYKSEYGKAIFAGYMIRFRFDRTKVNPLFVFYYTLLSRYRRWVRIIQRPSGQPNINSREFKSFELPLAPLDIQNHIVEIMQSAYAQKRQKDQEADTLLDSVDDYVLSELEIELPKPKNNRIENRIFTSTSSDVSGRRFDPEVYYQVYSLYTEAYPMERFQNCALINPPTSFYEHELNESITFVPMEKVSAKYREADLSLCKLIREAKGYTKFSENDLIWAKITPCMQNGKSAVVDNLKGGIGVGSTEFHVFRALEGVNIRYIHALLRLKSLREHAVLHFTGSAGQQRVPSEFFKNLTIPKPPIEKQDQIASHIDGIHTQAKQLQQEANAIVERAKREVEQILLEKEL